MKLILDLTITLKQSMSDKRKWEGKLRSKVWQQFTKNMEEDGRCEKWQCNHCLVLAEVAQLIYSVT